MHVLHTLQLDDTAFIFCLNYMLVCHFELILCQSTIFHCLVPVTWATVELSKKLPPIVLSSPLSLTSVENATGSGSDVKRVHKDLLRVSDCT